MGVLLVLPILSVFASASVPGSDWRDYGGDPARSHFSPLQQIDKHNVHDLRVAWVYHAGGNSEERKTSLECTPLVVDGVMFITSSDLHVIALDAASGRQVWRYDPFSGGPTSLRLGPAALSLMLAAALAVMVFALLSRRRAGAVVLFGYPTCILMVAFGLYGAERAGVYAPGRLMQKVVRRLFPDPSDQERHLGPNRGLTYWEAGRDKRVFFAGGHKLVSLDARTGRPVPEFGRDGVVDLTQGLERKIDGLLFAVTSPGVIYKDLIVIGSMVGEGPDQAAPGYVRAYSVRTGEQKWLFHTIPQPQEGGYNTWPPDAWKRVGGANAWGGMTVDEGRGLVFVPVGSATFDFYGGDRAGRNLFSDCLVALDASTGKLVWYYQMVHHDLWDYDLPSPPTMVTVRQDGRSVDALAETTKNGFVFVLRRDNGEPLFPVEERSVPASDIPGEQAWPTQPVPLNPAPLCRLEITENDLTDLSPEAHAAALAQFRGVSGARMFSPPSKRGTIVVPGLLGGSNWGGVSYDHRTSRLIVNTNDIPYLLKIIDAKAGSRFPYDISGYFRFVDEQGYPAIKPPWGRLTAIDLNTGNVAWQVPLGEFKQLTSRGIPITGTENAGGSIATASGLVFIAATKDKKFRAFDIDNGKTLWETDLDAAGHATPATYAIGPKQYVVIAAGGGSMVESASFDEYVAFALPDRYDRSF
jgi:quinoprotein glucose dehydrogenase